MKLLGVLFFAPTFVLAQVSDVEFADAKGVVFVHATNHSLAGHVRLAAALRACDNEALAQAIDLSGPEMGNMIRESMVVASKSGFPGASTVGKLNWSQSQDLVGGVIRDFGAYKLGYMSAVQAWSKNQPEICKGFIQGAVNTLSDKASKPNKRDGTPSVNDR